MRVKCLRLLGLDAVELVGFDFSVLEVDEALASLAVESTWVWFIVVVGGEVGGVSSGNCSRLFMSGVGLFVECRLEFVFVGSPVEPVELFDWRTWQWCWCM